MLSESTHIKLKQIYTLLEGVYTTSRLVRRRNAEKYDEDKIKDEVLY